MTIQDFITQNTGKKIGTGQCVPLVELYAQEVLNTPLPALPSAVNYWKVLPGYTQESSPKVGDIAVYNSHPGFPDGHIAIVNQLTNPPQVFEQNADPDGSPAHLFQRSTIYLLGYLRKDIMRQVSDENMYWMFRAFAGREPTLAEVTDADYYNNADLLISTLVNNGFKQNYPPKPDGVVPYSGPQLFVKS